MRMNGLRVALLGTLLVISHAGFADAQDRRREPPPSDTRGLLVEPAHFTNAIETFRSRTTKSGAPKDGFYPRFKTRMSGSGWLAAGPGYRQHLFSDLVLLDVSGAMSFRRYTTAEARVELRPHSRFLIGSQFLKEDWTQAPFYGIGSQTLEDTRTQYRLRTSEISAYSALHVGRSVDLRLRAGLLNRAAISGATGWRLRPFPDTSALFSDASAPGLDAQPRFGHGDVTLTVDTLDHSGHPRRGMLVQASASLFKDRDLHQFSFRRYEIGGSAFVPLVDELWTIGVRGVAITTVPEGNQRVPFYMLPSLGDQTMLRGYENGRYQDRAMAAVNIESRWALFRHIDAAIFADAGQVAPRLNDLGSSFKSAYGAGLRIHTGVDTLVRFDVARGESGWHLVLKLNDSFGSSSASTPVRTIGRR
jgi:hypothetical protein